jgi:hypothetical protein
MSGLPQSMNCEFLSIFPQISVIVLSLIASGIREFNALSIFSRVTVCTYLSWFGCYFEILLFVFDR